MERVALVMRVKEGEEYRQRHQWVWPTPGPAGGMPVRMKHASS